MTAKNAFYAQSGGVTAVINSSACGVIETARACIESLGDLRVHEGLICTGDSFMAGLLASLAEARPLREAVMRGSACASIVVSNPGCAPAMPTTSQLDAFLATHPGPTEA